MLYDTLTLLHHADVHAALQSAGLAVAAVVLGDGAGAVEGAGEAGLALHAPSEGGEAGTVNSRACCFAPLSVGSRLTLIFVRVVPTPIPVSKKNRGSASMQVCTPNITNTQC